MVGVHLGAVLSPLSTLHNCYGSLIKGIQSWLPLGIALHKSCGVNGRNISRLEKKAHNLEGQYQGKRAPCQRQLNKTSMQ